MVKPLSDLVSDWGGFEELIRKLHSTGTVAVQRNVTLAGRSGATRQIDVLVTHTEGLYEHKIVVECKYWNSRVDRQQVDALAATIREVGASKGVIFSVEGFQEGAVTQAAFDAIQLFKVREPTDREWGLPGRNIDFWVHILSVGLGDVTFEAPSTFSGYEPDNFVMNIDFRPESRTHTPINLRGYKERTLEELLEAIVRDTARRMAVQHALPQDNRESATARIHQLIEFRPEKPIVALYANGVVVLPTIRLRSGVEIHQFRFQMDRAKNALFVLVVEDCISQAIYSASHYSDDEFAAIKRLEVKEQSDDDALKNGSLFQVWLTDLIGLDKFEGLPFGQLVLCDEA